MEGTQPCVTDADNAAVRLIECTSPSDYDKSNSECQKTEFEFEFINRTSNFQTLFNKPTLDDLELSYFKVIKITCHLDVFRKE